MRVTGPELFLIAATRGMLGVGIGLLAAGRLADDHRSLAGRILVAIGVVSTIPLAWQVFGRRGRMLSAPTKPLTDAELAM